MKNRLAKLDKALVPNIANLDPKQLNLYYDAGNVYSLPYQFGMTGIAYDKTKVNPAPTSWADLFDTAKLAPYKNRVSMLDDERESVGAALKFVGGSYNSTEPELLAKAKAALLAQKPLISRYDSESVQGALASGEVVLAHAWNFQAAMARLENPNIEWVLPSEGGGIWQDNLAIPADAPHAYAAHIWINNALSAQNGARLVSFGMTNTPNLAAAPLLDASYSAAQKYVPTDDLRQRLEWVERSKGNPAIYSDLWTQIKGQ